MSDFGFQDAGFQVVPKKGFPAQRVWKLGRETYNHIGSEAMGFEKGVRRVVMSGVLRNLEPTAFLAGLRAAKYVVLHRSHRIQYYIEDVTENCSVPTTVQVTSKQSIAKVCKTPKQPNSPQQLDSKCIAVQKTLKVSMLLGVALASLILVSLVLEQALREALQGTKTHHTRIKEKTQER